MLSKTAVKWTYTKIMNFNTIGILPMTILSILQASQIISSLMKLCTLLTVSTGHRFLCVYSVLFSPRTDSQL